MGNIMKALCLTLLFFAYSFGLLGTGMFLEKRVMDVKENEQAETQQQINIEQSMTTEEYHKYYEIVVSRIITSEFEGFDKEAIKTYIKGYDERFNKIADLFYPKRDTDPDFYGTSFPMMFSGLKKAFDENELNMYKGIIMNTSMAVSNEDMEIIFKNPAEKENTATGAQNPSQNNQGGQDIQNGNVNSENQESQALQKEEQPVESSVEAAAKRALEGIPETRGGETPEQSSGNTTQRRPEPSYY